MNIKLVDCQYYEGTSKKTGKPYQCFWLRFQGETGYVVTVPVFLPPWEWERLAAASSAE